MPIQRGRHILAEDVLELIGISPEIYGAYGDGETDDTEAVYEAFSVAEETNTPVLLKAPYLTETVNYRGQSIIGVGSGTSKLVGMPEQDVLHVDPTVSQFAKQNMTLYGFTLVVDDSVNADASFPNRHGVGNAGLAVDYPDGSDTDYPLMLIGSKWDDVQFTSTSWAAYGQNKSVGIYTQFQSINLVNMGYVWFERLDFGWWDDYPVVNVASSEHARDHVNIDSVTMRYCGNPWRVLNAANWNIGQIAIHTASGSGILFDEVVSAIRNGCHSMVFGEVMIEYTGGGSIEFGGSASDNLQFSSLSMQDSGEVIDWKANDCIVRKGVLTVAGAPAEPIIVTGARNEISPILAGNPTPGLDQGAGNHVVQARNMNVPGQARHPIQLSRWPKARRMPDSTAILLGHAAEDMFVSGDDLTIPGSMMNSSQLGAVQGVDFTYVVDTTFGLVLRQLISGHVAFGPNDMNGTDGFKVGRFIPAGKGQLILCAKAATSGLHQFGLWNQAQTDIAWDSKTINTTWTIVQTEYDTTGLASGHNLRFWTQVMSADRLPLDIAWVGFRPHNKDILNNGVSWKTGTGSPEGVVTAPIGSLYSRLDGGASTSLYVKTSGTGNTGWTAK